MQASSHQSFTYPRLQTADALCAVTDRDLLVLLAPATLIDQQAVVLIADANDMEITYHLVPGINIAKERGQGLIEHEILRVGAVLPQGQVPESSTQLQIIIDNTAFQ